MEHLPAGMQKGEGGGCHQFCRAVLRAGVCVGETWGRWGGMSMAVSGLRALCVHFVPQPLSPTAARRFPLTPYCCGQKAGDQPSGRHLWALNSPLSYAPRTMGLFLHKMGMRDPVMDL